MSVCLRSALLSAAEAVAMKILYGLTMAMLLFSTELFSQQKSDSVLAGFEPFLNKIYKGYFLEDGKPTKSYDTFYWEKILNGNAIRGMHSVNDGVYGGETIFRYDAVSGTIQFYYFTTAKFMTLGTVAFEGDVMITEEKVEGNEDGVTQVRAETRILSDGRVHVKSQIMKKGEWTFGHEIYYTESPNEQVKFKK